MNSRLYNDILNSIGMQVKYAIKEQFNINDINYDDDSDNYCNIFDKLVISPPDIFNRILNGGHISVYEIRELNHLSSVVKPAYKIEL